MDFKEVYLDTCSTVGTAARDGDLGLVQQLVWHGKFTWTLALHIKPLLNRWVAYSNLLSIHPINRLISNVVCGLIQIVVCVLSDINFLFLGTLPFFYNIEWQRKFHKNLGSQWMDWFLILCVSSERINQNENIYMIFFARNFK